MILQTYITCSKDYQSLADQKNRILQEQNKISYDIKETEQKISNLEPKILKAVASELPILEGTQNKAVKQETKIAELEIVLNKQNEYIKTLQNDAHIKKLLDHFVIQGREKQQENPSWNIPSCNIM